MVRRMELRHLRYFVVLSEELGAWLRTQGYNVHISHRDVTRG